MIVNTALGVCLVAVFGTVIVVATAAFVRAEYRRGKIDALIFAVGVTAAVVVVLTGFLYGLHLLGVIQ